ncbi:hypothetical protein [Endozoicomonas lisbonensis]|uniref:Uncharacterized protein n=1 Tax=Endozoicomonas lisbonensis TaxID=3120522 RepID=A0ABV2SRH3_9GAMM
MSLVNQKQQTPSEFAQLGALLDSGWLSQLESLWQSLFVPFQPGDVRQTDGLIKLVSYEAESRSSVLTVESAADCLNQFKELVGHFRNFNLEW